MRIINKSIVYQSGQDGYAGYRIPSLIKATDGSILAFCEGRRNSLSDVGYIEIIAKRSIDNGLSWSEQEIVVSDGINTFGNCCCVTDNETSRIHMVCNFNYYDKGEPIIIKGEAPRDAYYVYSDDDGYTWSKPKDITKQVKKDDWGWLAFGPCHGIQTKSGRIVFPCNYTNINERNGYAYYSFVVYSDDGCTTFNYGEHIDVNTNECAIAQLNNNTLYINMRSYKQDFRRKRAYSIDEGQTWTDYEIDDSLMDPICQGSVLYIDSKGILAVCNNASQTRTNLTLRLSKDGGKSWNEDIVIHDGFSAYSDLVLIDDSNIGCLYEYGDEHCYQYIGFATITLD